MDLIFLLGHLILLLGHLILRELLGITNVRLVLAFVQLTLAGLLLGEGLQVSLVNLGHCILLGNGSALRIISCSESL